MAFILKPTNNFTTDVTCFTPDGDKTVEWKFKAEFRVLTQKDIDEGKGNILKDALVSVSGVPTEGQVEQGALLDLLRSRPDTSAAMIRAYNDALTKKNRGSSLF